MPLSYYIYFRVESRHAETLWPRIHEMQAALLDKTGVHGKLLKKRHEPLMWMEVYENVNAAARFEQALGTAVEQYRINDFLPAGSARNTECFEV